MLPFFFSMASSTEWFLASKLCTGHVIRSTALSIVIISDGYCWSGFRLCATVICEIFRAGSGFRVEYCTAGRV